MDNKGDNNNGVKEKGGLYVAIQEAMQKGTEKERIIAVLDCIKGYRNEYDPKNEKPQFDGFVKCKSEYKSQIKKVQDYILKNS